MLSASESLASYFLRPPIRGRANISSNVPSREAVTKKTAVMYKPASKEKGLFTDETLHANHQ
jgi:hypothetical protein